MPPTPPPVSCSAPLPRPTLPCPAPPPPAPHLAPRLVHPHAQLAGAQRAEGQHVAHAQGMAAEEVGEPLQVARPAMRVMEGRKGGQVFVRTVHHHCRGGRGSGKGGEWELSAGCRACWLLGLP